MYVTIFIDMLARCVNPDVFPQGALVSPLGVELTIKLPCRLQIALVCVHAPRGLFRLSFFAPPSSPQSRKRVSAALLCLRGNYFRPHFSIPQPRPQGFSLKKWVGREKALASAGHVSPRTP